jgi:hypothetical protein
VEFQRKLEERLSVPVDLWTAETIAEMPNPYRLRSINAERKTIYEN